MKRWTRRAESPAPPLRLAAISNDHQDIYTSERWTTDGNGGNGFPVALPSATPAARVQYCCDSYMSPLQRALSWSHVAEEDKPCVVMEGHVSGNPLSPVATNTSPIVSEGGDPLSGQQDPFPRVNEDKCSRLSSLRHLECGENYGDSAKRSPTVPNWQPISNNLPHQAATDTSLFDQIHALVQVIGGLQQAVVQLSGEMRELHIALLHSKTATLVGGRCGGSAHPDLGESMRAPGTGNSLLHQQQQQQHEQEKESVVGPGLSISSHKPLHTTSDSSHTDAVTSTPRSGGFSTELDSCIVDAVAEGLRELETLPSCLPPGGRLMMEEARRRLCPPDAR